MVDKTSSEEAEISEEEISDKNVPSFEDVFQDGDKPVVQIGKAKRMTIAYFCIHILGSPAQFVTDTNGNKKDQWKHKLGTITKVCNLFPEIERTPSLRETVKRVLINISLCKVTGTKYCRQISWNGGRPTLISLDSDQAQVIADSIEQENSLQMTQTILNH